MPLQQFAIEPNVVRPNYRRYWLALYRRDVATAERVVEASMAAWSPQRVYLRLFEPALNLSGVLWARGRIHHDDEHFVTYHTLRFMRRVRRAFVPTETNGPLAVATGVGQESHLIGLRMVCDYLKWANWRVHWLASNDRATVADAVERLRPAAVMLSIGMEGGVTPAGRLIADLRRRRFTGLIAVGGRVVNQDPTLVERVGADLTAPNGAALHATASGPHELAAAGEVAIRRRLICRPCPPPLFLMARFNQLSEERRWLSERTFRQCP